MIIQILENLKRNLIFMKSQNSNNPKNIANNIDKIFMNKRRYMKIKKEYVSFFDKQLNFEQQYFKSYGRFLLDQ